MADEDNLQAPALAVNHVGITVPDIFAAIRFYSGVFGAVHIMGPRLMEASSGSSAETNDVLGRDFRRLLQAHLLMRNGVGIELFEPIEPSAASDLPDLGYRKPGLWHLALQHPEVDAMVDRIVANGGRRLSATHLFVPGKPWMLAYAADPWGTRIEIVSHRYAEMFSNWPQPGAFQKVRMVDEEEAKGLRAATKRG